MRMLLPAAFVALLFAPAAAALEGVRTVPAAGAGQPFYELNVPDLTPGEELEYTWGVRTAGALTFDIHWHDGRSVRYVHGPEAGATGGSARVTVPGNSTLSFFWENKGASAVDISYDVRRAEAAGGSIPLPLAGGAVALLLASLARRPA